LVSEIPAERKIILPGSFNPLHDGHIKLMEVATRYRNPCSFDGSIKYICYLMKKMHKFIVVS